MSGHDPRAGLISAFVNPFIDEASAQGRRPPHAQRQSHAGHGAFLLTWCWVTFDVCGPAAPMPDAAPMLFYAWWASAALGAYWLLSGLFGRARGPLVGGLGLLAEAAGASWLLWNEMYPAGSAAAVFLLHGLYLSVLCNAVAQFVAAFLAMRRDDALALVDEDIAENEFTWE